MEDKKHILAVYGSLRRNMGNHRLLIGSKFIGKTEIETNMQMYDLGYYPTLIETKDPHKLTIELYEVDELTHKAVEHLEGYPSYYQRKNIRVEHGGNEYDAQIYYWDTKETPKRPVPSGDWTEYKINQY